MTDPPVLYYAQLCAKVYSDPPQYGKPDGAGRACVYDGVVTFRGTDDPASMLADCDVVPVDVPELGTIHGGFWSAFGEVAGDLMKLSPQVITGHSLGGALALIYAAELCRAGKPPSAVYAFEPPHVCCDSAMNKLLDAHGVMRWACRNAIDPVPLVPPGFSTPAYVVPIGKFRLDQPDPIWYHLIDNVIPVLAV